MPAPSIHSDSGTQHSNGVLPLFRSEALAARQDKFYGEILLIRPFSITFLSWLGAAIAAAFVAYLLLGHYTERARISGVVVTPAGISQAARADLYVPARDLGFVHVGQLIPVRCSGCSATLPATVEQVSSTPSNSQESSSPRPTYKVRVAFANSANDPAVGGKVEADLPLERKPLLKWLFARSGA